MATLKGTNRSEDLIGTNWTDKITGGGGHDFIEGMNGNDRLIGDSGDDFIRGHGWNKAYTNHVNDPPEFGIDFRGSDDDVLGGGYGNDVMVDWRGNNKLDGGDGDDSADDGAGNSTLIGGRGNDYLSGGPGTDTIIPGMGDDFLDDVNIGWLEDGSISYFGDDRPDTDLYWFERNLGPVGHDVIDGYDVGYDRIQVQGYRSSEVVWSANNDDGTHTTIYFSDNSAVEVYSDLPFDGNLFFI